MFFVKKLLLSIKSDLPDVYLSLEAHLLGRCRMFVDADKVVNFRLIETPLFLAQR
jgi:hypothetical protein